MALKETDAGRKIMSTFQNQIKDQLQTSLKRALESMESKFPLEVTHDFENLSSSWCLPPRWDMGHLSFPCFQLAKKLKSSPAQLATDLAKEIKDQSKELIFIEKINPVGPYLNFFLKMETTAPRLLGQIEKGDFFQASHTKDLPPTMIEYFQPNTHKEVHVGHLRNLCLGQAMVELHRYLGHHVISSTYPGDSGTHVAKSLWFLKKRQPSLPSENLGQWLGEIYAQANQDLESEKDPSQKKQNQNDLSAILKEISQQSGPYFDLWEKTRTWSLDHIKEICKWADVSFDHWYFESEIDSPSLTFAKKLYDEGLLVKDDGAIIMDLKEEKLGVCLIIKRDGNGLYATKDLELARRKFEDYGIKKSIYIVDKRQSFHFKQVFKTLEKIGYKQAQNCHHLEYEFVELPEGALSSRSGNIISAKTFIEEMEETIKEKFLARYQDWTDEAKNKVAHQIAQGAIKYGMTSVDNNKKIVFNKNQWLQLDGESGPYIQYAHARICSLLEKVNSHPLSECDWSELDHEREKILIVKLSYFNHIVENACLHCKTSLLATYLYELAKDFNGFYAECPLLKAETENLRSMRFHLAQKTATVLCEGLRLLGIPAPRQM